MELATITTQELAARLSTTQKGFNGKVYGGVNEPLHIFVKSDKIEVDETFATTYAKAYEVSQTDEAFDASFESTEAYFQFVLAQL